MVKTKRLNYNELAPDLQMLAPSGDKVQLSSLWQHRPLLLAFTRHFGCTQCKEMLNELVSGKEEIEKAGLVIAVVMQGSPEQSGAFAEMFAPGLKVLADPDRKVYRAYGLERGNIFQTILNPKIWSAISRARRKGYQVETPPAGQDAMQMSGTFIIGTNGRIELPYYYDNISDHPSLELLLGGVLSTRWNALFEGPVGPGADKKDDLSGRKE